MQETTLCTLTELTELVEHALSVDYPGAPTSRVRAVPDQRAIRWYVTRGLVDRPVASRGRMALYGRRHLLQLVAIKRRQAQGASLAEIQAELAGATDHALAQVARLPDSTPATTGQAAEAAPTTPHPLTNRSRFWTDRPAALSGVQRAERGSRRPAGTLSPLNVESSTLQGIRLAPGITLLIEDGAARTTDPTAILAAARPLLDLLARHDCPGAGVPYDSPGAGVPHDTEE